MATYYSDIFTGLGRTTAATPVGSGGDTIANITQNTTSAHARMRTTIGHIRIDADEDFDDADVAHMLILKPTDRLVRLQIICDATGAGTLDLGVSTVVPDNGTLTFTVSDDDLFASQYDWNAARVWVDLLHESATVPIEYIGRPMWEIANLGAGTFTADEKNNFAITMTAEDAGTTADNLDVLIAATYIAGD